MLLPVWFQRFLSLYSHLLSLFGLFLPCEQCAYWNRLETLKKCSYTSVSILLVVGYGYLQWFESQNTYKTSRTSNIILLSLTDTLLTTICIISTLGNVFWNKERWFQFLKLFNISRKKMQMDMFWRNKTYMVLEIVLGHFVFVFVLAIAQYRNFLGKYDTADHLKQITANFIKDIMYYYMFLTITVIYNTALALRNSFEGLKNYLIKSLNTGENMLLSKTKAFGNMVPPISIIEDGTFSKLLEASKIFNILFGCVEIFNKIFGVVILFLNIATVLTVLVSLNTLLISGETDKLTVEVAINAICGILMFVTWNSFVTSACGLLKREAILILNLCCKLQHSLPHSSKERQELLNLARQISRECPRVSAAGFFDVDFSLIFSVFSYVGTYIVVLIQFSYMDF